MSQILTANAEYAEKMKTLLRLRYEPVAVKLIKEGGSYPASCKEPDDQMSHCQAVFKAKMGECLAMPMAKQSCHVGASALNMIDTPDKIVSGEFHAGIGMHDSPAAAAEMIAERMIPKDRAIGEAVCPLSKADFEPDVVIVIDIPERIYWVSPLTTAEKGGRVQYSTSPFQCVCEDLTSIPLITAKPNISLGCFGCRRKTDMKAEEMGCGVPYALVPEIVKHLEKYSTGVMAKAKRD